METLVGRYGATALKQNVEALPWMSRAPMRWSVFMIAE
jgi:hypothetical protein